MFLQGEKGDNREVMQRIVEQLGPKLLNDFTIQVNSM